MATAWAERLFYPVFIVGRTALLVWLFLRFGPVSPLVPAFVVASFAILLAAERWIPHRPDWRVRGDDQIRNDLGHSVAYSIFGTRLGELLFVTGAVALIGGGARLWSGVWPDAWPSGFQIALVIFLGDGLEYAYHRLTHSVAWLWPLHVLHHTPERLHTLKTFRHHWLYAVLRGLFVGLPLLALGAPLALLPWVPFGLLVVGAISHANVAVRLPAFAHRLLNNPEVHRIHHSIDPAHHGANFCFVFPFWDLVGGTFVAPERTRVAATGLEDDPVPPGFLAQLALPPWWSRERSGRVRAARETR